MEITASQDLTYNRILALEFTMQQDAFRRLGFRPVTPCSKRRLGSDDNCWLTMNPAPVEGVAQKDVMRNPVPPCTPSTLQQDSFNRLGFSPSSTMQLAQQLYEGPESAGGTFSGHHDLCISFQKVPPMLCEALNCPLQAPQCSKMHNAAKCTT